MTPAAHFHIRWNRITLDWECFDSREDAVKASLFSKARR